MSARHFPARGSNLRGVDRKGKTTMNDFQITPIDPAVNTLAWDQVHLPWSEIPSDYRTVRESGQRLCMYWDDEYGTTLGPWHGPNCTVCPPAHQS